MSGLRRFGECGMCGERNARFGDESDEPEGTRRSEHLRNWRGRGSALFARSGAHTHTERLATTGEIGKTIGKTGSKSGLK